MADFPQVFAKTEKDPWAQRLTAAIAVVTGVAVLTPSRFASNRNCLDALSLVTLTSSARALSGHTYSARSTRARFARRRIDGEKEISVRRGLRDVQRPFGAVAGCEVDLEAIS